MHAIRYSIANGIAAGFIFYNWCVIIRFFKFRFLETFNFTPTAPKNPKKSVWEAGWNTQNDKDFLPHWVMVCLCAPRSVTSRLTSFRMSVCSCVTRVYCRVPGHVRAETVGEQAKRHAHVCVVRTVKYA
jgi:hypothetical protein